MSRDPWDCPPGACKWSAWHTFSNPPEELKGLPVQQYRQCDLCDRRESRKHRELP